MIVLLDMDGPLADLEHHFLSIWKERYPNRPRVEFESRKARRMWDDYPKEYREDVQAIVDEPGFYRGIPPVPGSIEKTKLLHKMGHEVFVCTAPRLQNPTCASDKLAWTEEHLGEAYVSRVILTRDKTIVRGDVLFDDDPAVRGKYVPTWKQILFEMPFNRHVQGVRRAHWKNITEIVGPHYGPPNCPQCGAMPEKHEVRNHSMTLHEGDVMCGVCGAFVRDYDAG